MVFINWAIDVLQKDHQKDAYANLKKIFQYGLIPETRNHEVGIASNRKKVSYGEFAVKSCTHCPSHAGNQLDLKFYFDIIQSLFYYNVIEPRQNW